MPRFDPAQLAAWTDGQWTRLPAASVTGFAIDTRRVKTGDVFVALRTDQRDGHDFLGAALAAGASGALVQHLQPNIALPQLLVRDPLAAFQLIARNHRRGFSGPVAGVSGSAGKTSTKDLLARLLGERVLATEGNLNNHLGVPLTLTRLDREQHGFAVIEAGISAPGEMCTLASMIEPDVAVITLVDHAHTRDLGGLAGVAFEKSRLPAAVRAGGVVILPRPVAQMAAFADLPVRRLVVERSDVLGAEARESDTISYVVTHRGEETAVSILGAAPLPEIYAFRRVSDGMAQNAVLAISVARFLGVESSVIRERLTGWGAAPWRGELRREQGRLVYVDCYNANPASMADALASFCDLTPEQAPRLYVLGGMEELGEESERKHRDLGESLSLRPQDRMVVIGTGARSVCDGALAAGASGQQLNLVETLNGVDRLVASWAGPVFIKGSRRYHLETVVEGTIASAH